MKVLTRLVLSVAAVALLDGALLFAQTKATAENVPTIPALVGAEFLQAAARSLLRRGHRHRDEFERARVRLPPQRRYAAVRVRPERRLRQGMGRRPLRHRVRAPGARRSAGQRVGGRRGDEHGHQVQPRGTCRDGARPPARARRRRDADAERAEPSRARSEIWLRTSDRRHVGRAGQYFRFRRLCEFPRGEVRQERPLHRPVRRRRAWRRAESAEHSALDFV